MNLENVYAFSSCGDDSRKTIQSPAGGEGVRDPTGEAEEALMPPRGKQRTSLNLKQQQINL
ncbi:hypothetical protein BBV17_26240 [Cytobacillus oceanisediminis]|uniref:Uncharacterized protein n=1 Tax=Cytobacillus oceanisediminis TaxID=665099 RepID=A0ABX3CMW2_9BACI|nr:hypothetical protein BBV17_26240 [Cytobacillus oceanisediminis]